MSLHITEGTSPFTAPEISAPCTTYYKKVVATGSIKSGSAYPLVILHGGPFLGHNYCLPLQELATHPKISYVLFYDQIGCGKSTALSKGETSFTSKFWEVNTFQLKCLLEDLKLTSTGFYLFGHSLGSILGPTYAAAHPKGLKALILASAATTFAAMREANLELFKRFPSDVVDKIVNFEEFCLGKRTETSVPVEQYLEAAEIVRSKHFNRATPRSENFNRSMANCMERMDVFGIVCGGTIQFLWAGPLSDHDTTSVLSKISAPTLVVRGEYDQALPSCQDPFLKRMPNVKTVTLSGGSHVLTDEVPEKLNSAISDFVTEL